MIPYDTVTMTCHTCGDSINTRTFAGLCCHLTYGISDMPWEVQQVFDKMIIICKSCGARHLITTHPAVSVALTKKGEKEINIKGKE